MGKVNEKNFKSLLSIPSNYLKAFLCMTSSTKSPDSKPFETSEKTHCDSGWVWSRPSCYY